MVTEAAGQEFLLTTMINICVEHLLFICSFRLCGVFRVEERVELMTQSFQKMLGWLGCWMVRYIPVYVMCGGGWN